MAVEKYTGFGETRTIRGWADRLGVKYMFVWEKLRQGQSIEEIASQVCNVFWTDDGRRIALKAPIKRRRAYRQVRSRLYAGFGEEHTCSEWACLLGLERWNVWNDLNKKGLSVEEMARYRGVEYKAG